MGQWGIAMSPINSRFWSNFAQMFLLIRNKVSKIFSPNSKRFLRQRFLKFGNFRTFFQKSTILNFPYLMKLSQLEFYTASLHENLHLCTFLGEEAKNHIKNWPWALETGLILNLKKKILHNYVHPTT